MKKTLLLVATLVVTVLAGCSRADNELLTTIPADADMVTEVNLKALFSHCGGDISTEAVKVPEALDDILGKWALDDVEQTILPYIDSEHMIIAARGRKDFVTFIINDLSGMTAALENECGPATPVDGFDLYGIGDDISVVIRDNQGWIVTGVNAAQTIKEVLDDAAKAPFGKDNELPGFLDGKGIARALINLKGAGKMVDGYYAALSVDVEDNIFIVGLKITQPTGELLEFPGVETVNTDFLRYVPDDFNFAVAVGLQKDIDWDGLANLISTFGTYQMRGMLDAVLPYLRNIDGTVSIAAKLTPEMANGRGQMVPFIAMVHMPQEKVNECVNQLVGMLGSFGVRAIENDGLYTFALPGTYQPLVMGSVDGCLTIASIAVESTHSNSLNTTFLSRKAALSLSLPIDMMKQITPKAVAGMKVNVEVESDKARLCVSLIDSKIPVLEAILALD